MAKQSFSNRIMAVDRSAAKYIKQFMLNRDEYIIVSEDNRDDEDDWTSNTYGLPFHNKHGFDDYAHVTRVFKKDNELWIEGEAYEDGRTLQQPLRYLETGDSAWVADLLK